MNYYRFESKDADNAFLRGELVACPAVLKESDFLGGKIEEGKVLVIMLSSGKKYMGRIVKVDFTLEKGYAVGQFEVVRKGR